MEEELRPESKNSSQFGKFVLRQRLGVGGMAEVFLAEMTGPEGFGKLVALKRILPHLSSDDGFTASFISEARLGGSLNHPNIVQTLELGREGEHFYLAMEYVQGVTLADLIRVRRSPRVPLTLALVLDVARQLCDGLAYAHAATDNQGNPLNMIHRDLKPDNVLLSQFGAVKITDFGVAKASSNLKKTVVPTVKGTIAYMSPEQAAGEALDYRSDLYSFGAILFEMLTLEPLYPNAVGFTGLSTVQRGDISDRLSLLESFPEELKRLLEALLNVDRERRPASALEIKRKLSDIAATQPTANTDLGEIVRLAIDAKDASRVASGWSESMGKGPDVSHEPTLEERDTQLSREPREKPLESQVPPSGDGAVGADVSRTVAPGTRARRWPWLALVGLMGILAAGVIAYLLVGPREEEIVVESHQELVQEVEPVDANDQDLLQNPSGDATMTPARGGSFTGGEDTAMERTLEPGIGGERIEAPATLAPDGADSPDLDTGLESSGSGATESVQAAEPGQQDTSATSASSSSGAGKGREQSSTSGRRSLQSSSGSRVPRGTLSFDSVPSATVYVDGRKSSRSTPWDKVEMRSGRHRLILETPDGRRWGPKVVTIRSGEDTRLGTINIK